MHLPNSNVLVTTEITRGRELVIQTLCNSKDALWNFVLLTASLHTNYCNLHLDFFGLTEVEVLWSTASLASSLWAWPGWEHSLLSILLCLNRQNGTSGAVPLRTRFWTSSGVHPLLRFRHYR